MTAPRVSCQGGGVLLMDLFGMAQLTIPATNPDLVLPKRRENRKKP